MWYGTLLFYFFEEPSKDRLWPNPNLKKCDIYNVLMYFAFLFFFGGLLLPPMFEAWF